MRVRTRQPTGPDDITLHVLVTGRHVRSRGFLNEFLPSRSGGGGSFASVFDEVDDLGEPSIHLLPSPGGNPCMIQVATTGRRDHRGGRCGALPRPFPRHPTAAQLEASRGMEGGGRSRHTDNETGGFVDNFLSQTRRPTAHATLTTTPYEHRLAALDQLRASVRQRGTRSLGVCAVAVCMPLPPNRWGPASQGWLQLVVSL